MPVVDRDNRPWQSWPDAGVQSAYVRSFGDRTEDLDMDFARLGSPELVSTLLHGCLRSSDGARCSLDEIWSWSLPIRLQGLLAVAAASEIVSLSAAPYCRQCSGRFEIEIDIRDFARDEAALTFDWCPQPGHRLSVRLPTGLDQQKWLATADVSAEIMARDLVQSVDSEPPSPEWRMHEAWVEGLAEQLEQYDPLTALELRTRCPACDAEVAVEFDLEGHLLARLREQQLQRVNEIHVLASAYHWSEADIVQLPTWRRRYYLAQLGAGEAA